MDVPINIVAGQLPSGVIYNPQTYFEAIVARMTVSLSSGSIIFGQLGGAEPNGALPPGGTQPGLWFGNPNASGHGYWNDWNASAVKYLPIVNLCGQYINGALRTTTFQCGASTANQVITTPDESGTMALLSDLPQQLGGTQTFSELTIINLDWNHRVPTWIIFPSGLALTLDGINQQDGVWLDIYLENNTGAGTPIISVPGTIWSGGTGTTAPTLSTGVAATRVVDHIRLCRVGGIQFGTLMEANYQFTGGHTSPLATSITGNGTQVTIVMTHLLAGGTLLASDFTVRVNGVVDATVSAIYSGNEVAVFVANAIPATASVTIQYTGTDMKSLAGDTCAMFGPLVVNMIGGVAGIHNDP